MSYSYWKQNKHDEPSIFELFFRKNPFKGEYTVFAGLEEALRLLSDYRFTPDQIAYVRESIPGVDEAFLQWLATVDCSKVTIRSLREGTLCFPRVPLLMVEGPLAICQLLETPLLCLINFPTLVATNAARHRLAAGKEKTLLEFGLRRAQGPDGALSATRYATMGGFDGSSNMLAGQLFGFTAKGTMAHSFVTAFTKSEWQSRPILVKPGPYASSSSSSSPQKPTHNLREIVRKIHFEELEIGNRTHQGELMAFVAFAESQPNTFLALIDTYDTLRSGVLNFLSVALALHRIGYHAKGIRLDSGDLAYFSKEVRALFIDYGKRYKIDYFPRLSIVASNDIKEATLLSLNQQKHEIDVFGIGTHLVTCQAQPALGAVYKLVQLNGLPRLKISEDIQKVTIPGKKKAFRLISANNPHPVVDIMMLETEPDPKTGERILCKHPFNESKRAFITPSKVVPLHSKVWTSGQLTTQLPSLSTIKTSVMNQLINFRSDHLRPLNPTPYKVSVSEKLYQFLHRTWMSEAPIHEL
eukprot:CAMPEP_0201549600 /NCGR_PEP_ID=MMETSP0173_2-20130828/6053_1 /ASSEMBLY_ACC=CAM_ASM_000268 /TAXON_ID=218659 /ORGANISM="Vexillifera sp., Strain DIVA3 564/2" /LENGTH=525 /DNA_ID=CAMNT_0047959317 /DNA_START=248 /DNA_END=1825 /DNA_ORIENTATION=+